MTDDNYSNFFRDVYASFAPLIEMAESIQNVVNAPEVRNVLTSFAETADIISERLEPTREAIAAIQESFQVLANSLNKQYSNIEPYLLNLSYEIENIEIFFASQIDIEKLKDSLYEISTQNALSEFDELFETDILEIELDINSEEDVNNQYQEVSNDSHQPSDENELVNQIDRPFYKKTEWYQEQMAIVIYSYVINALVLLGKNLISEIDFIKLINDIIFLISTSI